MAGYAGGQDWRQSLLGLGSVGADLAPTYDIPSAMAALPVPQAPPPTLPSYKPSFRDKVMTALGALDGGLDGMTQARQMIAGDSLNTTYDRLYNHPESDILPVDANAPPRRGLFGRYDPTSTRGQLMQQAIERAALQGAPNANTMQNLVRQSASQALAGNLLTSDGHPVSPQEAAAALVAARSQGVDIGEYQKVLDDYEKRSDKESYLAGVPQVDRPLASMAPTQYAEWTMRGRRPQYENLGNGTIATIDPQSGQISLFNAPRKAPPGWHYSTDGSDELMPDRGGPADPSYIGRVAGVRRDAIVTRPIARAATGRGGGAPTTGKVIGAVVAKVASGQPLTSGEQELYDRYRQGPSNFSIFGPTGQAPQAGPPAPAPVRPVASAARVQSKADLDRLPKGAPYVNPADGRTYYKKY